MLSPWKLPSLGILDSRLQDFLQCCSPECNFQDHNLWAAPLLCLPLLWVKRWLFYFSSLTWSFPFIRWERFAASKGFSCHQGQSFDVKRLGIENCTCELSGKAKQILVSWQSYEESIKGYAYWRINFSSHKGPLKCCCRCMQFLMQQFLGLFKCSLNNWQPGVMRGRSCRYYLQGDWDQSLEQRPCPLVSVNWSLPKKIPAISLFVDAGTVVYTW